MYGASAQLMTCGSLHKSHPKNAGFVFIPRAGELDSLAATDGERWIDVNLLTQSARAMEGNRAAHSAAVTTGKPGFDTIAGHYTIPAWGRTFNETMTSSQAGIQDPNERYDVHNVLYTQYFDGSGDALHLNYWQPEFVFGRQRTSHGCVGLELHDAQYLWLFARPGMRVEIGPPAPPAARTPAATAVPSPARATPTPAAPTPAPVTAISRASAGAIAQAVPSPAPAARDATAPAGAPTTPTP